MLAGFAPELPLSTFSMKNILSELSGRKLVKSAIKANWEHTIIAWGIHQMWNYP